MEQKMMMDESNHIIVFHHQGDYSGGVIIEDATANMSLRIPVWMLVDFVADMVRDKYTARMEALSSRVLLGLDLS